MAAPTPPSVTVVDKRGVLPSVDAGGKDHTEYTPPKVRVETRADPVDALLGKVFKFIVEQPEFYKILQLDKPTRKRLEKAIAKMMTRYPHLQKLG